MPDVADIPLLFNFIWKFLLFYLLTLLIYAVFYCAAVLCLDYKLPYELDALPLNTPPIMSW